jgi:hypothetical protein
LTDVELLSAAWDDWFGPPHAPTRPGTRIDLRHRLGTELRLLLPLPRERIIGTGWVAVLLGIGENQRGTDAALRNPHLGCDGAVDALLSRKPRMAAAVSAVSFDLRLGPLAFR